MDLKVLENFFQLIIKSHDKEHLFTKDKKFEVKESYFVLNSKDFDDKKNVILEKLKNGKKLFLITSYQTLGAGQNIQYEIDHTDELIKLLSKNEKKEKDFDAIYLDLPTNLLVNLKEDEISEFDLNKRIFQLEFLFEKGSISYSTLISEIKETFKKSNGEKNVKSSNIYQTQDYRNFIAKKIIQAIGRITRTNYKNKTIYIFADKKIAEYIADFNLDKIIALKEFEALKNYSKSFSENISLENPNNSANLIARYKIISYINSNWKYSKDINYWKELRDIVLKFPVLSESEYRKSNFKTFYFKSDKPINRYYFSKRGDQEEITIDRFDNIGSEVSAEEVKLNLLTNLKEVKDVFLENNYATDFKKARYILLPYIFNAIYKGALGEIIGKTLIELYTPLILKELPDQIFEKFDFMTDEGIFIDFKFWNEEISNVDSETQIDKILKKADLVKAKKVFIINILASNKSGIKEYKNKIITIPYLVDIKTGKVSKSMIKQIIKKLKE